MNIVAIIQAHMGSTRLPGKVLLDLNGCSMLGRVVRRAQRAQLLSEVTVACSTEKADEAIVDECQKLRIRVYRGSDSDVLARYHGAAVEYGADVIVRITSDCPLIEPEIIDKVVAEFQRSGADYASNTIARSYPRGLDAEVFKRTALDRAWSEATEAYQHVHVTPYLYQHPESFKNVQVRHSEDLNELRWTVDTPEDFEFISHIYRQFHGKDDFSWREVIAYLNQNPEVADINRHIRQKELKEL
jgi:spore coat polysaccharide biosynthesis protein SpsF